MKHIFQNIIVVIALLFAYTSPSTAQTVGYTYKALAAEGCSMKYGVVKQDMNYYIIATVRSDRMNFLKESTMKIRTFSGDVITLKGEVIGGGSESGGVVIGSMVIPVTEIRSTAQFSITPEEFELLNNGVSKVRLSMIPMDHERTFKKDKIGRKLYLLYLKAKAKDEDF